MSAFQQNAQEAPKSYQGGPGAGGGAGDHGLSTNYYLQKVSQHNRATSDGAMGHQMQQEQAKDLAMNLERQQHLMHQQNQRKIQHSKDKEMMKLQQQAQDQRKYSLQLSLQDSSGTRGSS